MERQEREKNESFEMTETELRELIREVLMTEDIMNEELSKKTKATLKRKPKSADSQQDLLSKSIRRDSLHGRPQDLEKA